MGMSCSVRRSSYLQGQPRAQYLTDVRLDSLARIVDDDTRWQWSQGGGGVVSNSEEEEVRQAHQEDPSRREGEGEDSGKVSEF